MMGKVFCPYCGEEMKLVEETAAYWYDCENCGATSPLSATKEEVYEAAMRRPLQKPIAKEAMTRSVICIPCYIETKERTARFAKPVLLDRDSVGFYERYKANSLRTKTEYFYPEEYGVTWRAWKEIPSIGEMDAVEWDVSISEGEEDND